MAFPAMTSKANARLSFSVPGAVVPLSKTVLYLTFKPRTLTIPPSSTLTPGSLDTTSAASFD